MNNWKNHTHEELFVSLVERLKQKKSEQLFHVQKAYLLAKDLHKEQFRQSGEPYIIHPVIVATILERLDFDTDVISAALLHDVVEDCNYTVAEIEQNFNPQIAEIVNAVTAIAKSDYKQELDSIYDNSDFKKFSLESKTYHKLLKIGKKNLFAFFIKFADRLHNLQTIGAVEEYKKLEKVKETEKWILPICELLQTSYFYNQISSECFCIANEKKVQAFLYEYETSIQNLERKNNQLKETLVASISNFLARQSSADTLYNIAITPQTPLQIFDTIGNQLQMKNVSNLKASHLVAVPTHDIFVVLKNDVTAQHATDLMFRLLEDSKISSSLKLIGYTTDEKFHQPFFVVTDNSKNKYRICTLSYNQYIRYLNGTTEGTVAELIDEENSNEIETQFIKVKTRSGQVLKVPQDSTLLDFAFKIHNDIGFSFKYGLLNNSPTQLPHYTKLKEGDKVSIICETDPVTKENKYVAQIRWLAYVKTEGAKKTLIRYFEKMYHNNNLDNNDN